MSTNTTASTSTVSVMDNVILTAAGTMSTTATPVTITVTTGNGDAEPAATEDLGSWESVLAVEGSPSSDRRYLIPTEIGERELPIPLRMVASDEGGHDNAVQVGRIEKIEHIPLADFTRRDDFNLDGVPDSAIVVWGEGSFDGPPDVVELAKTMIRNGAGVSIDLPHDRLALFDPETLEEIPEDQVELSDVLSGSYLTGLGGKIAAATIVDIPAFEEASIRLIDGQAAVVASAFGIRLREALVASVGLAPLAPPKAWFELPEADGPTPLTVTDDGQVFGHLATWDQCHASFPGSCELAPRSKSNYKFFHLGMISTAEGESVPVGRVTVGKGNAKSGGHNWDLWSGAKGAIEHYDRTGAVAAFVRAIDGKYGIWLCGSTRSDASPEAIRDMRANPPSGDWRWEGGGLELVAALSVPVPGYPVPYLVSSSGDHPVTLIAAGYVPEEKRAATRSELRRKTVLLAQAREELAALCPDCGSMMTAGHACSGMTAEDEELAKKKKKQDQEMPESMPSYADEPQQIIYTTDEVEDLGHLLGSDNEVIEFDYNADQRRKMAKSGEALPDGSFPIANCSDAEKAIHAQGRAQDQGKAVAHIKKRVSSLGCSGDIFDNYK